MSPHPLTRPVAVLATGALTLAGVATTLLPGAPAAAATTSVALVGSLQSALGCTADWDPACAATELVDDDGDGVWTGTFTVPAGSYEFKVALNDAWDESYGDGDGNYPLALANDATLTFSFDDATNTISVAADSLPGAYDATADAALAAAPFRDAGAGNNFYFVLTDRFSNGSAENDTCIATGHAGADGVLPVDCTSTDRNVTGFDPTNKGYYHGGDIQGIRDQLDYIEGLGTTALWLTPSFVNMPVQGAGTPDESSGYHGYWITDFTQIDPHLGTNAELAALIDEAHARGIEVYFDIIANHTADVIYYADHEGTNPPYVSKATSPYRDTAGTAFDPADYTAGTATMPPMNPDASSFPYDPQIPAGMEDAKYPEWLNDPTLYHNRGFDGSWPAGEAATYMDFANLDDLMTENQIVVDGMTDIYEAWADLGIDGFRIDTVKHVDFAFWQEFTANLQDYTAESNPDFFMFGEVYDADARLLSPYVRSTDMNSVLDFAFQSAAVNFVTGSPALTIASLFRADDYYTTAASSADSLPTFLGNHDMGRIGYMLRSASNQMERDELAHSLMYLTRGQPVVYYGDEQGLVGDGNDKDAREDMTGSQVASYMDNTLVGGDAYGTGPGFDTSSELYQHISALADLRASEVALRSGAQVELFADGNVFAFSRVDRTEKREVLVAVNSGTTSATVTFGTLTPGASYAPLYGTTQPVTAGADGTVTLTVPALSAIALKAQTTVADSGDAQAITVASGAVENGLTPLTATIADNRWAETSFSYRLVGDSAYTPLGTAEDDTPRVFADFSGLPAGSAVEVRAVSVDADGSAVASSALVITGTTLAATPDPDATDWATAVTIPGSHNTEMGCASDWQPDCELALLTRDEASGLYTGTFTIAAGTYEYKVAVGGTWDENYGAGGVFDGSNSTYTTAGGSITFYYDPVTHYFFNTAQSPVITLPGSFNSAVGCPDDWMPSCLNTLMFDPDGDGVYTYSTTALPAGSWAVKVAHGLSWAENYGQDGGFDAANIPFSTSAGKLVTFSYTLATHQLVIEVEDPPLAGTGQFLGHFVDAATIAWPADLAPNPDAVSWTLYSSPTGGIALTDGAVTGGTAVGTLTYDPAGLTDAQLENRGQLRGFSALHLTLDDGVDLEDILTGQLIVVQTDANGVAQVLTGLQLAGVLDALYAGAAREGGDIGVTWTDGVPTVTLWAPTATAVDLLVYPDETATGTAETVALARQDDGTWTTTGEASWANRAYLFDVTVYVPSEDEVLTNQVTDPYSQGLTLNSTASVFVDLDDPQWAPATWTDTPAPTIDQFVDRTIYELHVRDFSYTDETVPQELRGTYDAFSESATGGETDGQRMLGELADAGINTVHLLPTFDIATIEEDRAEQVNLTADQWSGLDAIVATDPASAEPQETVMANADADGFNWGYDPFHFLAPEGSYAPDGEQVGGARTESFREMVGGLHQMGLQVVLDQVYNHTSASGQADTSVLDQVVPGYYHRLSLTGAIETSTCCQNLATENQMTEQLMVDSVVTWASDYHVDGFRFDLMGHHSVDNMTAVREALDALTLEADGVDGSSMYLYGEGWNFGEVAGNARFTQATQGQLDGTHIGAFNDRLRDAVHGGEPFDEDKAIGQGFGTGLYTDPNEANGGTATDAMLADLRHRQDLIRLGLAGNLESVSFETAAGTVQTGAEIDYNGSPAGYASEPDESVNYVDAHDNETLFDIGVWKLPLDTAMADRIRMNTLSLATVVFGQSPAFWHGGTDLLRSKSMDRNSYNSGDWFNELDWSMSSNNFGQGLPPEGDNGTQWDSIAPRLADIDAPTSAEIGSSHDQALELLQVRTSQPLLTLGSATLINQMVTFPNAGADQTAGLIVMRIDDQAANVDPNAAGLLVAFNSSPSAITETIDGLAGVDLTLAPTLTDGVHDDAVVTGGTAWDAATGALTIPARSAVVLVQPEPETIVTVTEVAPPTFTDEAGTANDTYTIPVTEGVEYLVDGAVVAAGTYPGSGTVTVTARAIDGYAIAEGVVVEWSYTFDDSPQVCAAISDVPESQPFYAEINWLVCEGISRGWPNGDGTVSYRPGDSITRDAMAAFLYRLAGSPDWQAPLTSPFVDVPANQPFYHEITWLAAQGITTGWSGAGGAEFRPEAFITRDAMAAFLYRFAEWENGSASIEWSDPAVSPFVDVPVSQPFYTEITWLASEGISTGWQVPMGAEYRPEAFITRDAMAAFLYRLDESVLTQ